MLNEIETNGFVPIQITNFRENGFVHLIWKNFETEENESNSETRKLFVDFCDNLIDSIHKHFLVMFLDKFTASIILIEPYEHGSELNSVITVFCVFEKNMF